MIIERTQQEYEEEIRKKYLTELKPLLDNGMRLTPALRKIGVPCQNSKGKLLRKFALEDGYKLKPTHVKCNVIERTEEEYLEDIRELYETELKPLLLQGYSLTASLRKLKVASNYKSQKYKLLRKFALDDGYKLRKGGRLRKRSYD